jgi:hypothetical protein
MAIFFPSLENIYKLSVKPTEGEEHLLNFLKDNLDDTYEIYFQSFINGDRPDVVLMRRDSGVMIIEVKDWDFSSDFYSGENKYFSKSKKNPLDQVFSYKNNLFNLHIKTLLYMKLNNPTIFNIISCVIYFHNAKKRDIQIFETKRNYNTKNVELINRDSLTSEYFSKILSDKWLNRKSKYFDETLYESFKRYLQPPLHTIEQGSIIDLLPKQKELINSRPTQQKIKGVAGSGKTLILARRAVNAHKRTKNKVLILTFNVSLKNYIHNKINEVRDEFYWDNFHIINFHQFFKAEANNYSLKIRNINEDYINESFFEDCKHKIPKYETILIDEVQDYKIEWLNIIKKYFLAENGEFVLFGDEKQNIYKRDLEKNKNIRTNIVGRWNELNESFRLHTKIANIATNFQKYFFLDKYELDKIKIAYYQTFNDDTNPHFEYYFLPSNNMEYIFSNIIEIIIKLKLHPNDIGILSTKTETIRDLDFLIRSERNEKTEMMCETKEESESFTEKGTDKLNIVRRNKKSNFWMNPGTIKLSTIHSFKGWEIHTLFLIIEEYPEKEGFYDKKISSDELIYTGITRCKYNLIIFNIENIQYDMFFKTIAQKW